MLIFHVNFKPVLLYLQYADAVEYKTVKRKGKTKILYIGKEMEDKDNKYTYIFFFHLFFFVSSTLYANPLFSILSIIK